MSQQTPPSAAMADLWIDDDADTFVDIQAEHRIDLPILYKCTEYGVDQWAMEVLDVLTFCELPHADSPDPAAGAVLERARDDIARGIVANSVNLTRIAIEEITPHAKLYRFMLAAYDGDGEALKGLIAVEAEEGTGAEYEKLIRGAFFMGVVRGNLSTVTALLDTPGVDVNKLRDKDGRTAVDRATQYQQNLVLRYLLTHGAQVDVMALDGLTAFHRFGASVDHEAVVKVLAEFGADVNGLKSNGEPELYCHAAGGDVVGVRQLLKLGVNPSRRTSCRWCPLHWAANDGHLEVVKLLVEAGADVNNRSDTGVTPLDLIIGQGEVSERARAEKLASTRVYLMEHGARVSRYRYHWEGSSPSLSDW